MNIETRDGIIKTHALIDNAAGISLIDHKLTKQIGAKGKRVPLVIEFADKTSRRDDTSLQMPITLRGTHPGSQPHQVTVHTMDLHLPTQSVTRKELETEGIQDATHLEQEEVTPLILLGLDNMRATAPMRTSIHGGLVVSLCHLGWSVAGAIGGSAARSPNPITPINHVRLAALEELQKVVHQFIDNEDLGINPGRALLEPTETMKVKQTLENNVHRNGNKYSTRLLWKDDSRPEPCNFRYALSRLFSFEKKMKKHPHIREKANEIIENYRQRGYIERTSHPGEGWFLPIFEVENTTKLRLVWDAAARFQGESLNNHILKGPDLNEPLWNILHRFRQEPVAFCADISEMFHQIEVDKEDRKFQKFLWRDQPSGAIEEYEMKVLTFGAACSPTIAQHVKNKNADHFAASYPEAAWAVKRNHYVDDWLQSCQNTRQAILMAKQGKAIQEAAGFKLHKWKSNRQQVLFEMDPNTSPPSEKNITGETKALGLRWNTSTDNLTFDLNHILNELREVPTKREMLKTVMSLFDPLGLVAFETIMGRLIMRETWKEDGEWDDPIPERLRPHWRDWCCQLRDLPRIKIPRWCGVTDRTRELHIFVDASERALCAAAYIKGTSDEGKPVISLAASKCKLSPTKQKSIPRLELQAAVLGVRLAEMILKASTLPITKTTYWTDARDVLWWLNSRKRRYRQFVALRVAEILEFSSTENWRWVPSQDNPADIATKRRGGPDRLDLWLHGPMFLYDPETQWPITPTLEAATTEEIPKVLLLNPIEQPTRAVADPVRIGKWTKLVRATAIARRVITEKQRKKKYVTQEEYAEAEKELFREAQREFLPERHLADKGKRDLIQRKSELFGLDFFVDKDNLIRFRSRLHNTEELHYDAKYPIILPRQSLITKRILENYHRAAAHANTQTTLNEVRQKFMVKRLQSTLNKIIRSCQWCLVQRAKPVYPQMGDHPPERLGALKKPFSFCGIDYFGPITTTNGRKKEKRWGVLFTCLTTRAVHLEMASSLSGEACVRCIENMVARRGPVRTFRSDNGTNFVWAAKEYKSRLGERIKWMFNPPAAPHQGGAWERLVGSVKKTLQNMEMPDRITDDQLLNFLIRAESLINCRPLTDVPAQHNQPALTPNHFLIGSSNGITEEPQITDWTTVTYDHLLNTYHENQDILQKFWDRWTKEYLPTIATRTKWNKRTEPLRKGDLVFICEPTGWIRGTIEETLPDPETNQVREATIRTSLRTYRRPATRIAKIKLVKPTIMDTDAQL